MQTVRNVRCVSIVFLVCACLISGSTPISHKGLYTNYISEGEIVTPVKIGSNGDVSHNLTTFHDEHDGPLLINVTILKQRHSLVLNPVIHFFTENTVIERHKRDGRSRTKLKYESTKCHYQGTLHGDSVSNVAVSTCNGLSGLIHTKNGKYWIEPYHQHHGQIAPGHKHIIYKRSAVTYHRDNKKRRKKQRHSRNCATREHPRATQLEWERRTDTIAVPERKPRNRLQNKQRPKKPLGRKRRSVSKPWFVETLLVADQTMVAFHEGGDIETYLLTIMNIVSSIYRDPSIGNLINVVVVQIVLLEDAVTEPMLNVSTQASESLRNFCIWQNSLNPDAVKLYRHDAAILITRKDLCDYDDNRCTVLGVAHISGMCDSRRSCSLNEDCGIALAHTIAHELGHNFGMFHDTEKIGCMGIEGNTTHIMTPHFKANTVGVIWSNCSRRVITNFLDKGGGACLENEPQVGRNYQYPELPAGAMYNADMQCWLKFGEGSEVFPTSENICHSIWCTVNETFLGQIPSAAPGTQCGKHKWCKDHKCVPMLDPPVAIDGAWGEWGSLGECSRSCGAGVSIMQRECDHPPPSAGGRFCLGERTRYRICNTEECPVNTPSYRALQCTSFNNRSYDEQPYLWLPLFDKENPCHLTCIDSRSAEIVNWGDHAMDGTSCNVGKRDICISGICRKVGCDWIVGSTAEEDECGVCHGDGTGCYQVSRSFLERNIKFGKTLFALVPKGARNVYVQHLNKTRNAIAVSHISGKRFYLNGARRSRLNNEYMIAGSPAMYEEGPTALETLKIPGPLKETIALYVSCIIVAINSGIEYQYTLPKLDAKIVQHSWISSDWTQCSRTCGGGSEVQRPLCQKSIDGTSTSVANAATSIVDESYCDILKRPMLLERSCNKASCETKWWIGPWQPCSRSCSVKGKQSLRNRTILCIDKNEMALDDQYCDSSTMPVEFEPCKNIPLCAEE